jgi:bifunctional non-homologous end joining protein LigD
VVHHAIVRDLRGLLWIVNQNTITPHVWVSRVPRLQYPDICVFDLDPASEDDPDTLRQATLCVRDFLRDLGLPSWVKTSGSKGFHVVVPLDGKTRTGDVARFAHAVGSALVAAHPDVLTQEFSKADRGGRILVDTGRNGYSATFAAAYAVRARPGAPISAPCSWAEVERNAVEPKSFTVGNIADRVAAVGDVWADMLRRKRSLTPALKKLQKLAPT